MDECVDEEENQCHPNALCTNTEGSYVCRCIKGYEGDGTNCTGKLRYLLCYSVTFQGKSMFATHFWDRCTFCSFISELIPAFAYLYRVETNFGNVEEHKMTCK